MTTMSMSTRSRAINPQHLNAFSDDEQENVKTKEDYPVTPDLRQQPGSSIRSNTSSPLTPLHNIVVAMRKRLEQQMGEHGPLMGRCMQEKPQTEAVTPSTVTVDTEQQADKIISPGLARLRNTPGRRLKHKQKALEKMHQQAKANADRLNVGGGISIWPEMTNMRLDRRETGYLALTCLGLAVTVLLLFNKIHGNLFRSLMSYTHRVSSFSASHLLLIDSDNATFRRSLLAWHVDFMSLMDEMESHFHISLPGTSLQYKACVVLYLLAVAVLLYYLVDNILARSKLSPRRIKLWVSLVVVTGGWTLLSLQLLVLAQALEASVETAVHDLSQQLAALVLTDLELGMFRDVSTVWRVRCLPPTARGVLSIMGLLQVRDVAYYLQYYSLPVITALLTPVVQLVIALKNIYGSDVSGTDRSKGN